MTESNLWSRLQAEKEELAKSAPSCEIARLYVNYGLYELSLRMRFSAEASRGDTPSLLETVDAWCKDARGLGVPEKQISELRMEMEGVKDLRDKLGHVKPALLENISENRKSLDNLITTLQQTALKQCC